MKDRRATRMKKQQRTPQLLKIMWMLQSSSCCTYTLTSFVTFSWIDIKQSAGKYLVPFDLLLPWWREMSHYVKWDGTSASFQDVKIKVVVLNDWTSGTLQNGIVFRSTNKSFLLSIKKVQQITQKVLRTWKGVGQDRKLNIRERSERKLVKCQLNIKRLRKVSVRNWIKF